MMYALKLIEVPAGTPTTLMGKVLKLKSLPATVGRGQDASLVIQHRKLSRLHCRFYLADDRLHVRDLGSTNGTAVNGVLAMGALPLHVGDQVSLGGVVFQVGQWVEPAAAVRTEPADAVLTDRAAAVPTEPAAAVPTEPAVVGASSPTPQPTFAEETVDWRPDSPAVESGSQVHIDSPFLAKVGTADPERLPQIRPAPGSEVDPEALDLAELSEAKKDASLSALGNFFSQQNLKRS